jgi:hypothetical protein
LSTRAWTEWGARESQPGQQSSLPEKAYCHCVGPGALQMEDAVLARLVLSVIMKRPTCLVCIATKVGETQPKTLRTIERIGTHIRTERQGRCRLCGMTIGPVYSIARSA